MVLMKLILTVQPILLIENFYHIRYNVVRNVEVITAAPGRMDIKRQTAGLNHFNEAINTGV